MRVARPINKWYNDDENRIARQRQGVTSTPPPAAGDAPPEAAETLHRRDIIPISPPQGKRIFRTARDYYGLCSAILFPHIFYYTRRQKTMKKRKQNLPRPAVHRMELWWAALPTVPGHVGSTLYHSAPQARAAHPRIPPGLRPFQRQYRHVRAGDAAGQVLSAPAHRHSIWLV